MPQIAKGAALHFIIKNIPELDEDKLMRIENHKNDRFLVITRSEGTIHIREDGYANVTHEVETKNVKPLLSRLIDYEFPRSHKIRIKIRKKEEDNKIDMSPWSARKIR